MLMFYNGSTPWSPEIQRHRDLIDYCYRILQTKTNVLTSRTTTKQLAIKLSEYTGHCLTAKEALENFKKAWQGYKKEKLSAAKLKKEF